MTCGPNSVGPRLVAVVAERLRQVEDDGDRQAVVLPRQCNQRLARFGLHVGRIDDGQLARGEPLGAMKCSTSKASLVAA